MSQELELKFLKSQKISISFRILNRGYNCLYILIQLIFNKKGPLHINLLKINGFLEYQYPGFQECYKLNKFCIF